MLGHPRDPVHPFSDAGMLAGELPSGRLIEANSLVELRLHPERLTDEIAAFLDELWASPRAKRGAGAGTAKRSTGAAKRSPAKAATKASAAKASSGRAKRSTPAPGARAAPAPNAPARPATSAAGCHRPGDGSTGGAS